MAPQSPSIADLCKPLSAKSSRPERAGNGKEMTPGKATAALARTISAAQKKRQTDAARKKAGTI